MRYLYRLILLFGIVTTQSCQTLPIFSSWSEAMILSEEQEQIFSLLRQGKRYDELSKLHRQAVCKRLKLDYKTHTDWQTAWLLVYSLNDNFNCINLTETLVLLKTIKTAKNTSSQLHWLNKNQLKLLLDLDKHKKNSDFLRIKLKNSEEKLKEENTKIEELKAIESSINKKLDHE